MNTVFMGSPDFAVPALEKLIVNKYEIAAVYTQPDKPTGRGQQVAFSPVKQAALACGLNVIQPVTFKETATLEQMAALQPDIIVIAAYGQILPDTVLALPRYRCLNIHPSLLPKYRGPSPVNAAILHGDRTTGVTIMLVEKKVDSGPILNQLELAVSDDDTGGSLSHRLSLLGAQMLVDTIPGWISGKTQPRAQDHSLASYTRREAKVDGKIDWNLTADQLWRRVRAFQPWPGCYTSWNEGLIKIKKVIPLPDDSGGKPGEVIALPKTSTARVAVRAGQGLLGLLLVQPEGKREMSALEFAAGHRDFVGSVL
jgi:methionyl-tRNA formyltransferase